MFASIFFGSHYIRPSGQHQEVFTAHVLELRHLPLLRQDPKGAHKCKSKADTGRPHLSHPFQKIILKYRVGVPLSTEADGCAWARITRPIECEIAQARGRLRIFVRPLSIHLHRAYDSQTARSRKPDPQPRKTIYQLTQDMAGDNNLNFKTTPAICTRVAVMVRRTVRRFGQQSNRAIV